jgi:hypothetical protein
MMICNWVELKWTVFTLVLLLETVAVPNSKAQYARAEKTIKSTNAANGRDEIQKPRDHLSEFWPIWSPGRCCFFCAIKKNTYFRGG